MGATALAISLLALVVSVTALWLARVPQRNRKRPLDPLQWRPKEALQPGASPNISDDDIRERVTAVRARREEEREAMLRAGKAIQKEREL
ncbi:MAG: hypothetical protein WD050_06015 [Actinomycetota bacterium]